MNAHTTVAVLLLAFLPLANLGADPVVEDDGDLQSVLVKAKDRVLEESHLLTYKFSKGEVVQWKVQHLATNETQVKGNSQTSKMRSASTKQWEVVDVDKDGNITFVHSVLDVDMWQKVSGRQEIRYNSKTDKTAPQIFAHVAKTVGVPIATVTITPSGEVVKRDKAPMQGNNGQGAIAVLLPVEPVKVGQSWRLSNEIRVRRQDGQQQKVKTRIVYTLKSVKTGVATIMVKTELLTPVNDASIEAQLVQQLTNGELKFDIDAGRVLSQQIDWDETVVGFSGDHSVMNYLARFKEELVPADKMAGQETGRTTR